MDSSSFQNKPTFPGAPSFPPSQPGVSLPSAPPEAPHFNSQKPLKKNSNSKIIIAGISLFFLLAGGLVSLYLTQINQDVRQQASVEDYDLSSDENNCGAIGFVCPVGKTCIAGACTTTGGGGDNNNDNDNDDDNGGGGNPDPTTVPTLPPENQRSSQQLKLEQILLQRQPRTQVMMEMMIRMMMIRMMTILQTLEVRAQARAALVVQAVSM
jgi:hypothetical protein